MCWFSWWAENPLHGGYLNSENSFSTSWFHLIEVISFQFDVDHNFRMSCGFLGIFLQSSQIKCSLSIEIHTWHWHYCNYALHRKLTICYRWWWLFKSKDDDKGELKHAQHQQHLNEVQFPLLLLNQCKQMQSIPMRNVWRRSIYNLAWKCDCKM